MEQDKINVEVLLNVDDVLKFQRALFNRKFSLPSMIVMNAVFLLLAAMQIFIAPPFGSSPVVTAVLLFLPVFFFIIIPLTLKMQAATSYKTNKLLQKAQNYVIGAEGIEIKSESGNNFIKWTELYKAIETKSVFLLFVSKRQAVVLPKRCFNGAAEQMELLRGYMANAPVPKEEQKGLFFARRLGIRFIIYIVFFIMIVCVLMLFTLTK